jgi:hypothetical protein
MLAIRQPQLKTLGADAYARFMSRACPHLRKQVPETCAGMEDAALRDWIDGGVERAERHGIIDEESVLQFLEILAREGPDFDSGKDHPWVPKVLSRQELSGPEKVSSVKSGLEAGGAPPELGSTSGAKPPARRRGAMFGLCIRGEQMAAMETRMMRQYEDRVIALIAGVFPDRYDRDGEQKTRAFVQTAIRKAAKYAITEDYDCERYILLLVDRGIDFEEAPGMSGCLEILKDEELAPDARVSLVYRKLGLKKYKPAVAS